MRASARELFVPFLHIWYGAAGIRIKGSDIKMQKMKSLSGKKPTASVCNFVLDGLLFEPTKWSELSLFGKSLFAQPLQVKLKFNLPAQGIGDETRTIDMSPSLADITVNP